MKKSLVVVAMMGMASVSVYASNYGAAGCGLGSMLIDNKDSKVMQVLAATTNGTSGAQTFGISTGTSNCDAGAKNKNAAKAYVEANRTALANDIAKGNGETLVALSSVYNCEYNSNVGASLQKNYKNIFPSETVSSDEIADSLTGVMTQSCATAI